MKLPGLIAALSVALPVSGAAVEKVIFDTDVGGDIDDAGALAVLHALADRGEVEILAVGLSNGHPLTLPYTHAVNTWFGRPEVPIPQTAGNAPLSRDKYMAGVVETYPHTPTTGDAPDAVRLYRQVLAAQPDASVTLVTVGPPTNIARLLESGPDDSSPLGGEELVRRKVKFYGAGGNGNGNLPHGRCGFNYDNDATAARIELARMPVEIPMVFAGGSGRSLKIGDCLRDAAADHIIRRSYEAYFEGKQTMDRPTWDQLRVRPAARSSRPRRLATSRWMTSATCIGRPGPPGTKRMPTSRTRMPSGRKSLSS